MELMKNYSDLLIEIECIKLQIRLTRREYEYWSGIKMMDKNEAGIPLAGAGVYKTKTRIDQMDRIAKSLEDLNNRLEAHEETKAKLEELFDQFEGLEYKVAYKRYVEIKSLQQIADELGYSLSHIEKVSSRMKQKAVAR